MSELESGRSLKLQPGSRLGPYEILAVLGAGGMGEVYRARDTRLARDVALKVLPEANDEDSGRFRRFQTEAKAAAAFSHPNMVAVYDIGHEGGNAYIVSELVPGGTLKALLERGPLTVKRLLDLAIPMAEGLAAAHGNGIVHRDLKPDNILLTADGTPKIADFGLAKYLLPTPSEGSLGTTLPEERTREGTILGTVGYMSPEQAQGKPVDYRSDQFSFGSILYEMAMGARAFQGKSMIDTLAAIINAEPEPIGGANPRIPAPLCWIIERCHRKDPEGRYASTADLARELAMLREHLSDAIYGGVLGKPAALPYRTALRMGLPAVALLAAGLVAGKALWKQPSSPIPSFQQLTFRRGSVLRARYAPDGLSVLYSASWENAPAEIFTARLDGTESRPFGVTNADVLAVSSQGDAAILLKKKNLRSWNGTGTLAVVPLAGGAPREVLEDVDEADWSPDGKSLAVVQGVPGDWRLEYPIGHVLYKTESFFGHDIRVSKSGTRVAFVEGNDLSIVDSSGKTAALFHASPPQIIVGLVWRPGDQEILFGLHTEDGPKGSFGDIDVIDMKGHVRTLYRGTWLAPQDSLPDGRLLVRQGKGSVELMFGSSKEPAERNIGWRAKSTLDDMSEDGGAVLFSDHSQTYLRRTDGSPAVRLGGGLQGTLSPDGKFAVVSAESEHEISMIPIGPGQVRKVSIGKLSLQNFPRLLPDGKSILFKARAEDGLSRLYVTDETGTTPRSVSDALKAWDSTALSPDGKEIAALDATSHLKIYRLGGGPPRTVAGFDAEDDIVMWAADGKSLYVDREGDVPLRVERFDLSTGRKELWKTLVPPDEVGVYWAGNLAITRDGKFWAYNANRNSSDELWQFTGLPLR